METREQKIERLTREMSEAESKMNEAIGRRNSAEEFSHEYFKAVADVEDSWDLFTKKRDALEYAKNPPTLTDEEVDLLDYVCSDAYDED